jgi:hypothetical protein
MTARTAAGAAELSDLVGLARDGDRSRSTAGRRTYVDTYARPPPHGRRGRPRDVVQDSYLRLEGISHFAAARSSTWMYRITATTAYSMVKRHRRHALNRSARCRRTRELHPDSSPGAPPVVRTARPAVLALELAKLQVLVVLKDVYGLSRGDRSDSESRWRPKCGCTAEASRPALRSGRPRRVGRAV